MWWKGEVRAAKMKGLTGTAPQQGSSKDHSTIMDYRPHPTPVLSILVLLDMARCGKRST